MLIYLSQFLCTDLGVFCPYGRCSRREVRGWGGEGRAGETGEAGQPCYERIGRRAVRGGRHSASIQSHLQSNEAPSLPLEYLLPHQERAVRGALAARSPEGQDLVCPVRCTRGSLGCYETRNPNKPRAAQPAARCASLPGQGKVLRGIRGFFKLFLHFAGIWLLLLLIKRFAARRITEGILRWYPWKQ